MTTMELGHLDIFVKVVQTGSFTRAAEQLHSQKAHVSRVVSQLEADLGVRLLERTTRSLSLTEVGREFFERAVGILGAAEDARRAVQQAQGEPRGTLRLTCGVEFGMLAVNGWVRDYLRKHPSVNVDMEMTGRVVDIVHEGFDLAIRVGPLTDSSLAVRKLGDLKYGLFAAPGYLRRQPRPVVPQDLAQHALIRFSGSRQRLVWVFTRGTEVRRIEPAARLNANNSFAVRDAAIDGLGIGQLPWLLAAPSVAAGLLHPVLASWQLPSAPSLSR
ncbi:LysR family transcriptional regulator [Sphaerotilus sp.]|uniref:LysR family transcriptional regulator n=1 Tax=Sphaerotilus sp. TaxID=2093942 RepID=UPI002ACE5252|nr:LysR family transcriptional regulator [Sphaerotilus sp.]MDZ7858171.1 LysR family transcriptional regulator [Sphaerotilus sp.]